MDVSNITSSRLEALKRAGISNPGPVFWNLSTPALIEAAISREEGQLSANGAFVVRTGQFTGRSPKDKFIVRDAITENTVNWGPVNQALDSEQFARIFEKLTKHLEGRELFVKDGFGGADPATRLPIRFITEKAWHCLFGTQLFLRPTANEELHHQPEFTLYFAPSFETDPTVDGTRSSTCIAIDFTKRIVLICGTYYAGELKKSVFTILNFLLTDRNILPMHCSANAAKGGAVALFFGLSGTGKTTLSADPVRDLIGDDEHGWSNNGVFNFEGGCYAKCIRLTRKNEPEIWDAIKFGTVLENVVMDPETRTLDYNSEEYTENTRAAYPIEYITNARIPGVAGHPTHVLFLTADAFGVLPPISRLTPEQAMFHFLSGYTAKLAGTERGLGKEPAATFSACFGEPFLPRHPKVYATMLGDKLRRHGVKTYLVNTGWVGGAYGVGHRMELQYTRAMVEAAIAGELDTVETRPHPVFGVHVPVTCPGVPASSLDPKAQWRDGDAYDKAATNLKKLFDENFKKFE
ncbi:phosphoenolpyruvate carboxykinase (ATP), partial [Bryobacter aggregatus]|uniref:phosphoenolpyruvate carboxykinase (ATP) n=1 Tax=Bryobacter aggregatus TaxID=360054 RepID=UPI0004E1E595